jgi:hypothetical protein
MKKILIFLSLVASSALAQDYNIPFDPPVEVQNWNLSMDFEGTDATYCKDTLGDLCTTTTSAEKQCTTSPCPIVGTYSGRILAQNGDMRDNSGSSFTSATLDFYYNIDVNGTSDGGVRFIVGMINTADDTIACALAYDLSDVTFRSRAHDATYSTVAYSASVDVTYKIRLEYTGATDFCAIFVDASGGSWGAGALGSSSVDGASSSISVHGWRFRDNSVTQSTNIVDQIGFCNGTSIAVGTKCGPE